MRTSSSVAPLLSCLVLLAAPIAPAAPAQAQGLASADSIHLIERAIDAMGGLETLQRLHAVRIAGFEQQNMLEQSERPEGPYLVIDGQFTEWRGFEKGGLRARTTVRSIVHPPGGMTLETIASGSLAAQRFGERTLAAGPGSVEAAEDSLGLGPERVLLAAREAGSLRGIGTATFQGVPHDVVGFDWNGRDVAIYLNRHTDLPTVVEWTRVFDDGFWSVWGDVTARIEYGVWHLQDGGLMYPYQWTESRNGMPWRDRTILEFEANPEMPSEWFTLQPQLAEGMEARAAMGPDRVPLGMDFRGQAAEPETLAAGVTQIAGMWNIGLIEQSDGIVVLEAPISSRYSEQVIAKAAELFPGRPIKGVITTSDAWPHVAGIREYVALGIPIHALDLNEPLLGRIIHAPRTRRPDRLARIAGTEPIFETVSGPVTVGAGQERFTIYPMRGEGGERMLAVWFPEHRLLYASDLLQAGQGGGFFMPSYLADVEALVRREALDVETVFAMHMGPTPWQTVLDALAEIRARPVGGASVE